MPDRPAADAGLAADLPGYPGLPGFPEDLPGPQHWEDRYPPRDLPEGAQVTRFSPSPTGFLHIGGVYTAMIDADVARHSGGRYLVRVEDTDQARVAAGAAEQFAEAL